MLGEPAAVSRRTQFALGALGWCLVIAYLAQYLTAPPNSTEGGVVFNYVHRFSAGDRVFFDLFDYYGPLAWSLPTLGYTLAGQKVIGVRVCLLATKVVTVVLGYFLVRRLADWVYAALAAATLTALVGLPWAFFQVPYAAHFTLPLAIATWLLLLEPLRSPSSVRITFAAALTAAAIWTKLTTGAFVFAGGVFYLLYGSRPDEAGATATPSRGERLFRASQLVGLAAIFAVFQAYIRRALNLQFFVYLSTPLLLVLWWAWLDVRRKWDAHASWLHHAKGTALYAVSTLGLSAVYMLYYFGRSSWPYLRGLFASLHFLRYDRPFPPLGVPGPYVGFNEWFWPQLPWLATAVFAAWLLLPPAWRSRARERDDRSPEVVGLAAMVAMHGFVIYSRAGEPQLIQGVMPAALGLFVFAFHLERRLVEPSSRPTALAFLGLATAIGLTTIFSWPLPGAFDFASSDWSSPRLQYLKFHPTEVPYYTQALRAPFNELDRDVDEAARQIQTLTRPGEVVLVVSETELVTYASGTRPVGGRFAPLFYLTRAGMLDREGFLALFPTDELARLVSDPPRILVSQLGDHQSRLLRVIPELASSIAQLGYRRVGRHGVIEIWQRPDSHPVPVRG